MQKKFDANNREVDFDTIVKNQQNLLNHSLSMIPQMTLFIKENKQEKFSRWLGFIQGILFSCGIFTLNELREHNIPIYKK